MTKTVRFATPDDLTCNQSSVDDTRRNHSRVRTSRSAWDVEASPERDRRIMLPPRRPERQISYDFQDSMLVEMDDSETDNDYYAINQRICRSQSISHPIVEECQHLIQSIHSIVSPSSVVETRALSFVPIHDHMIWDEFQTIRGETSNVILPSMKPSFEKKYMTEMDMACSKVLTSPPSVPLLHDDELRVRSKLAMLARKIEDIQNRL
jgi:hypothetical protein